MQAGRAGTVDISKIPTLESAVVKVVHSQTLSRVLLAAAVILVPLGAEAQVILGATSVNFITEYASMTNYTFVGPRQKSAPIPGEANTSGQFGPDSSGYVAGSWAARSFVRAINSGNALRLLELAASSRTLKDGGNQNLHQISAAGRVSIDIDVAAPTLVTQDSGISNYYEITGTSGTQIVRSWAHTRVTDLQTNTVLNELVREETVQTAGKLDVYQNHDLTYVLYPGQYRISLQAMSYSFGASGFIGRDASTGAYSRLYFSPVPEPTSVSAMVLGLGIFLKRRKKNS